MTTRRGLITGLAGAAAWSVVARAQQAAMPVLGFLSSGSAETYAPYVHGFHRGLAEQSFVEGRNVALEYRWSQGQYKPLTAMASDLVKRQVTLIVASGGPPAALAVKAATSTIPIVFTSIDDPIGLGLVASLNRPGSNATGMSLFRYELISKQLELLRELAPNIATISVLVNETNPNTPRYLTDIRAAAGKLGQKISIINASTDADIDAAFTMLDRQKSQALLVTVDTFLNTQRDRLAELAARHGMPAISQFREFPVAGGLASYGTNVVDVYHQVGVYAGRILKGEKPADLPVMQPTKFELVVNLRTAKALGLIVPPTLIARADKVIE